MALDSVLAGWDSGVAARDRESARQMQGIQQASALQQLLAHVQAQQKEQAFRSDLASLGANPTQEQLAQVGAKYGSPADILKSQTSSLDRKAALETQSDSRMQNAQMMHEYRMGRLTSEIDRAAETARHNKAMEGLSGQKIEVNQTSKTPLTPEATRDLAIQSLYDPNATMGHRRDPTAMANIANARIQVMKETGVTSEDVVSGRAGFKADAVSLNKMTPMYDAIVSFENTAIRNGKILKDLAAKADATGVPAIERWIRAGRVATGDPDVAKLNAQMNLYRAEAARILTQPNLSGVLTDTARQEMEGVLRNQASATQVREVVDLLERDFGNRKKTLEEQIGAIRTRMRGRVAPGGEPAAATPAPAAPQQPAASGWSVVR